MLNRNLKASLLLLALLGCSESGDPGIAAVPVDLTVPESDPGAGPEPEVSAGAVPGKYVAGPMADPMAGPAAGSTEDHAASFERVIFVTIDTLRADHLGCYGYPRTTSPFIDRLAEGGVRFERALASISHTAPSHASMFTGLPPALHGVRENGQRLDEGVLTLAEVFGGAGYETAAVTSVSFLRRVSRGFDHLNSGLRDAKGVTDAAIRWLEETRSNEEFFLWLHYYTPHGWQTARGALEQDLTAVRERLELEPAIFYEQLARIHGLTEAPSGESPVSPKGLAKVELFAKTRDEFIGCMDTYDALINEADREVERFFDSLEALDLPGRTLWVITSDHGEGLGNHGSAGHGGRIYNEQLHVPLLFFSGDGSLARPSIETLVQHIDLLPTLAECAGLRVSGVDPTHAGRSLWPLIHGDKGWGERTAFAQRHDTREGLSEEQAKRRAARFRHQPRVLDRTGPVLEGLWALQTPQHKLLLYESGRTEFYDLTRDPFELEDLSDEAPREFAPLLQELGDRLLLYLNEQQVQEEIPAELMEELRKLGYVD